MEREREYEALRERERRLDGDRERADSERDWDWDRDAEERYRLLLPSSSITGLPSLLLLGDRLLGGPRRMERLWSGRRPVLGGELGAAPSGDPYCGVESRLSSCTLRRFDGGSVMGIPAVESISDMIDF